MEKLAALLDLGRYQDIAAFAHGYSLEQSLSALDAATWIESARNLSETDPLRQAVDAAGAALMRTLRSVRSSNSLSALRALRRYLIGGVRVIWRRRITPLCGGTRSVRSTCCRRSSRLSWSRIGSSRPVSFRPRASRRWCEASLRA